jgi:hypothetical protein
MFGIWIGKENEEWEQFKNVLDGFGKLKWICSDPSNSVVFLDLTLTINAERTIKTKTFVNPKKLHLYIYTSQQTRPTHRAVSKAPFSETSYDIRIKTATSRIMLN